MEKTCHQEQNSEHGNTSVNHQRSISDINRTEKEDGRTREKGSERTALWHGILGHNQENILDKDTAKAVSTSDSHKEKDATSHK